MTHKCNSNRTAARANGATRASHSTASVKRKAWSKRRRATQAIERIKKLGLYPTDLTDTAAGTGLNTEINIKAFEKYPSKKDFAVTARQLATMVAGWRLADPSLEHRHRTNREREAPQGSAGLRGASGRRLVLLRSHVGGSRFPVPADHGQHGSCRRDRRLPRQIAAHRGGQLRSGCEAPRADQKRHGLSGRGVGHRLILVMVMLLTIVPMFASMYDSMNAQLPFVTQILVDLGKVMPYVLPMLIVAVVALAMFWKRNRNKDIIRTWWDPFTLKAPVFGKLDTNVALARFCNNFSSMLASGVPILQALDIVGSTSGNYVIDSSSKRVGRLVERGYRLADSMSTEKIFPNMLVQMVAIGEDSGAIDKMLSSAGRAYDEEAQSMAKQLTSLLEPLMILFLGVVVGFMVVALYMPMFSMFDAINGQA